ncbi:MAG TPA: filamentous hemagglutinin family protein [Chthoniobacterales bacterium]
MSASNGLQAGVYTLLPARYALLPGAALVTPESGSRSGTLALPDGSNLVSGYQFNSLASNSRPEIYTQFEVVPENVIRTRATYEDYFATSFLRKSAKALGTTVPRLPLDSGHLIFEAATSLRLKGSVLAQPGEKGIGAYIDISSPQNIVITNGGGKIPDASNTLQLDASELNAFGAESLLIGGIRTDGPTGTTVDVTASNIMVANAGRPLVGPEIILTANDSITLARGAGIQQSGLMQSSSSHLLLDGNGALVRVSSDPAASISRSDITSDSTANLIVDRGAIIAGTSIALDSSSGTSVDSRAHLLGDYVSLDSGQISLRMSNAGSLQPTTGLVLAGQALAGLQGVKSLSLLSYSSIDIYGGGNFRIDGALALHAAEIRGFNNDGKKASFSGGSILLDNSGNGVQRGSTGILDGTLAFNADMITLGSRNLHIDQYSNLQLTASDFLDLHSSGCLFTEGDLSIGTPAIVADNSAVKGIFAQGSIVVSPPKGSSASNPDSSIGASLIIEGSSILADSKILLPSGNVTLHSTTGNLSVGGNVDVGGTAQSLYELVKYTDAGKINLIADQGSVNIANGSTLSVAAQADGGNAGEILVSVPNGSFNANGVLLGKGGKSGKNGSFSLDVSTLPNLTGLGSLLDKGSFSESRSFRVRNGDVTLGGTIVSHNFNLSADAGSIIVSGLINASGETGGTIDLRASESLTLASGAELNASGKIFNSAGKGGAITLEAGDEINGAFDPNARLVLSDGSEINLSVAANSPNSASLGKFTGTLHLRAPQDASTANTDLQMDPVQSKIVGASTITVEGYQLWDLSLVGGIVVPSSTVSNPPTQASGGLVTNSAISVQQSVLLNGQTFGNNSDAIKSRLFTGTNAGLADNVVVVPGAEIINRSVASTETLSLSPSGSISLGSSGGTIYFPQGTIGDNEITSSISGTIVTPQGQKVALNGSTPTSVPAGSRLVLSGASTISFSSGSSGSIPLTVSAGTSFTASSSNSSATISSRGTTVSLNSAGSSRIALSANSSVLFITGTPGTRHIIASVSGIIVDASGNTSILAANIPKSIAAGSTVTLNDAGTLSYVSGGSGTGTPTLTLLTGNFTTFGAVGVTSSSGDLVLGSLTTTGGSDWNLAKYRFGPQSAPGVLTLRAAGNLVFYNSLQDGFDVKTTASSFTAPLLPSNHLLPLNAQTWSYRLAAGADLGAADFHRVVNLNNLASNEGSLLLGKNAGQALASPIGLNGTTANGLGTSGKFYQVIRTGSGDIDISTGRDVVLQNQFATIYTAGTLIDDPTMGGKFDVPILSDTNSGILGGRQQKYNAQYSVAGGNISISAQNDITHVTKLNGSDFVSADSSRQLPINWLLRRGFVDPSTGEFGAAKFGDIASTSWWVNFSNFFEGVGALGGGDVSLYAGHDVMNVDAVAPTNARMPKGTPNADNLLELGGGDVTVQSGHDINGGVYYTERGNITLQAGHEITTNSTRSPSLTNLVLSTTESTTDPEATWLPTTLFLGKGSASVTALGDVLMGPVANPFLLPGGFTNTYWYKTYFSTYASTDAVDISSIGGSVSLRESATLPFDNSNIPILEAWLRNVMLLNSKTASFYQPWIRLNETNVDSFATASALLPSTFRVTAFSGDINLMGNLTLAPSSRGSLDLAAGGSINGLQPNGVITSLTPNLTTWATSTINLSDANPSAVPGTATPYAYQTLVGTTSASAASTSGVDFLSFFDNLFAESGSLNQVLQTKQTLHSSGPLHLGDTNPVHLYATGGDISGVTLFSGKLARVIAGHDLTDISLYIQNTSASDVSVVSAGHDIVAYDANSLLRTAAQATGNELDLNNAPLAGDIQINGPGTLEVLAGRNLDLGTGSENLDGTGSGITSIGNLRNPYLSFQGANIVTGAGIGLSNGLEDSHINFSDFISKFLSSDAATQYLSELSTIITPPIGSSNGSSPAALLTPADLANLIPAEQSQIALDVFFLALRDAGRDHNDPSSPNFGTYTNGLDAIAALFGKQKWRGEIKTQGRDIRTKNGGDIAIFAPSGSLTLANSTLGSTLTPPGIITEYGGNISIFTDGNVDLGIGRIFTLRGGNEIIWSTNGNIAAGAASKTVSSAPPVSVLIDPQSANVKTNLAGLSTGGGIGVLDTVEGVPPGNVDLIAPNGIVDAGDAGIRSSGNLNIAAVKVLNASNISFGGTSTGVPSAPVTAAPNISGLSSGASATGATSSAANDMANQARQQQNNNTQDQSPSIYSVDVLGYGGGDSGDSTPSSGGTSMSSGTGNAVSAERQSTAATLSTAPSPPPAP